METALREELRLRIQLEQDQGSARCLLVIGLKCSQLANPSLVVFPFQMPPSDRQPAPLFQS